MHHIPSSLESIIENIQPVDHDWIARARARTAQLIMPHRALGRLHEIAERLCGISQTLSPSLKHKAVLVMAGDHGVVAEGVSAYPQEVTGAMIEAFLNGGAGINAICRQVGATVRVVDMGVVPDLQHLRQGHAENLHICKVGAGTRNFVEGPAMSSNDARQSLMTGFQQAAALFENRVDILATGDMGIGNTTPSAAIGAVMTGISLADMVGPGTGIDAAALQRKMDIIDRAIARNQPDAHNGLDVLAKIGGFEIGGIAGCILAAAWYRRPVVVDGFISTAGLLIARSLCPRVCDYVFVGHCSEEPGHHFMLQHLQLQPILNLNMRLGEGTGAALALGITDAAVRVFNEVFTFEEAGVARKNDAVNN